MLLVISVTANIIVDTYGNSVSCVAAVIVNEITTLTSKLICYCLFLLHKRRWLCYRSIWAGEGWGLENPF